MDNICELCERDMVTTSHHLIPKEIHSKKWAKRQFCKFEMNHKRAWLCYDCHPEIHKYFTNRELAEQYNTVEKLLEHPQVAKFVKWVKKQKRKVKR